MSSLSASASCSHISETLRIPSRSAIINDLQSGVEYDVLIIGGGATGAGAALDARLRGLKVACVEREDFACKGIDPNLERSIFRLMKEVRYIRDNEI